MNYDSDQYLYNTVKNLFAPQYEINCLCFIELLDIVKIQQGSLQIIPIREKVNDLYTDKMSRNKGNPLIVFKELTINHCGEIILTCSYGDNSGKGYLKIKLSTNMNRPSKIYNISTLTFTLVDEERGIFIFKSELADLSVEAEHPYIAFYDKETLDSLKNDYGIKEIGKLCNYGEKELKELGFLPDECTYIDDPEVKRENLNNFVRRILHDMSYKDFIEKLMKYKSEQKDKDELYRKKRERDIVSVFRDGQN